MQVSIYVSEQDYETLSTHKPAAFRTTSMFLTDILRKRAEQERATEKFTADGAPIVPQYERS
jgi:hypothetical protein